MALFRLSPVVLSLYFFVSATSASAFPLTGGLSGFGPSFPDSGVASSSSVDFTATVALSGCSGALVRYETSLGSDRGMILTNAHCLQGRMLPPGVVLVDQPASRSFNLLSNDGRSTLAVLRSTRVIYATLTKTDLALYELSETFEEIERKTGIAALTLSSRLPSPGRPIAIPSGYWKRIYNCSIDRLIHELREDLWSWSDSIRYTRPGCDVIGGTSGSPIVDAETREVVGVNNTGNESGRRCTMNNPCEVDETGEVTVVPKASYGQQTFWIYGCLGPNNELWLEKPGCQLPSN